MRLRATASTNAVLPACRPGGAARASTARGVLRPHAWAHGAAATAAARPRRLARSNVLVKIHILHLEFKTGHLILSGTIHMLHLKFKTPQPKLKG